MSVRRTLENTRKLPPLPRTHLLVLLLEGEFLLLYNLQLVAEVELGCLLLQLGELVLVLGYLLQRGLLAVDTSAVCLKHCQWQVCINIIFTLVLFLLYITFLKASSVGLIYYFTYFSTAVPSNSCVFLSCRPFVANTTFSTGLGDVEVS